MISFALCILMMWVFPGHSNRPAELDAGGRIKVGAGGTAADAAPPAPLLRHRAGTGTIIRQCRCPATPLKLLSVIPPMTQLNTPYPSTAYLTGFLRSRGYPAVQEDLALALVLRLFSPDGLRAVHECIEAMPAKQRTPRVLAFERQFERYLATVEAAVAFLQGRDPSVAHRIAGRNFLPEGAAFRAARGLCRRGRRRSAGLGFWRAGRDGPRAGTSPRSTSTISPTCCARRSMRASSLSAMPNRWRKARLHSIRWAQALAAAENLVDRTLRELTLDAVRRHAPNVVLVSTPFPGNVYGAFRIAQAIKAHDGSIVTVLGGGFVNTELRELAEPRGLRLFRLRHARRRRASAAGAARTLARRAPAGAAGAHLPL
jgi:hypothetical protein